MDTLVIIGGAVIGILMSVVAFFVVRLVGSIDKLTEQVTVLNTKIASYEVVFENIKTQIEDIETNIDTIDSRLDGLSNKFNILEHDHSQRVCPARN